MAAEHDALDRAAPRFGGVGLLALLVFCAFLGSFASLAFAPYAHVQYAPEWGRAAWIGPGQPAAVGYYRSSLVLQLPPVKAHLQIAAPDGFDLYVNGTLITDTRDGSPRYNRGSTSATAAMVSALASGSFNVAPYLKAGKNILALKVALQNRPPRAELIVSGSWEDAAGQTGEIASDTAWRTAIVEEWQVLHTVPWSSPDFRDYHWPFANRVSRPLEAALQPVDFSPALYPSYPMQMLDILPDLFRKFPRGNWIWSPDRTAQAVAFRREFTLEGGRIREAWIGISSDAAWNLSINGYVLAPDSTAVSSASGIFMDTYEISRFLRLGNNTVELGMRAPPPAGSPRLAVSLMADVGGRREDFSSDARWLTRAVIPGMGPAAQDAGDPSRAAWAHAESIMPMLPVPLNTATEVQAQFGYPTVRIAQLSAPRAWWVERFGAAGAWSAGLFAANILLTALAAVLVGSSQRAGFASVCALWAHPCTVGTVVLGFVLLLQYDVRVPQDAVLQPYVFFGVWGAILAWGALNFLFLRARTRSIRAAAGAA